MSAIGRVLLSVYDKRGIVPFAQGLVALGASLVSTGGTFRVLREAGLPVTYVSDVTGFPEILGGRVKTLHPRLHGGLLARRDLPEHMQELAAHHIQPIDLVAVNLYPFREAIARPDATLMDALENIDIGGPAMIRAAAKNFPGVLVVVNPDRYDEVLAAVREGRADELRRALAAEAFAHTAAYDQAVAAYLSHGSVDPATSLASPASPGFSLPDELTLRFHKVQALRYGENPHQKAAFYRDTGWVGTASTQNPQPVEGATLTTARQLQGKELSFNNILDANAALEMVLEFPDQPTAVAVKHTNPCGIAIGADLYDAFTRARDADPVSIFGGIVAVNRTVDVRTAEAMAEIFLEVVLAPDYEPEALAVLAKKQNLRLLVVPGLLGGARPGLDFKRVLGGLLVQDRDVVQLDPATVQVVTSRKPTDTEWHDLRFGWRVVRHVKSNAIVVVRNGQTLGVGAGQMNRIQSTRLALEQAGAQAKGAVLASDAFFPFPDVVEAAAAAGVRAIIQPGGARRDAESIAAADKAGIAMVFTGVRHFRH